MAGHNTAINHLKQGQTKSCRRTRVWLAPHATFKMGIFGSAQTSLVTRVYLVLLQSFCSRPSCPSLPRPTISSLPWLVRSAVWAPPQLMVLILSLRLVSLRGKNWSDLSPCPSCPSLPKPQVQTSPLSVTTPEQLSPAEISTIFSWMSDSTSMGSQELLRLPLPSCPLMLLPHTYTLPY